MCFLFSNLGKVANISMSVSVAVLVRALFRQGLNAGLPTCLT